MHSCQVFPSATNPNVLTGKLTKALFDQFNGDACANMGLYGSKSWLTCRFTYAGLIVRVDWYQKANGNYDINWTDLLYPVFAQSVNSVMNGVNVLKANLTYQDYVGMTYNQCGSWSNVISNINSDITITGTQLQSNNVDFSQALAGLKLYGIIVKNAAGSYKAWQPSSPYLPFTNTSNYCSDIGVSYSTVLQGLSCSGGCAMTLILYDSAEPGKTFALMTQGFSTASRLLRA